MDKQSVSRTADHMILWPNKEQEKWVKKPGVCFWQMKRQCPWQQINKQGHKVLSQEKREIWLAFVHLRSCLRRARHVHGINIPQSGPYYDQWKCSRPDNN